MVRRRGRRVAHCPALEAARLAHEGLPRLGVALHRRDVAALCAGQAKRERGKSGGSGGREGGSAPVPARERRETAASRAPRGRGLPSSGVRTGRRRRVVGRARRGSVGNSRRLGRGAARLHDERDAGVEAEHRVHDLACMREEGRGGEGRGEARGKEGGRQRQGQQSSPAVAARRRRWLRWRGGGQGRGEAAPGGAPHVVVLGQVGAQRRLEALELGLRVSAAAHCAARCRDGAKLSAHSRRHGRRGAAEHFGRRCG